MCFFLCKAPISYYLVIEIPVKAALVDWEKNCKSLVNDVGNDDGGLEDLSQAKGGSARPREAQARPRKAPARPWGTQSRPWEVRARPWESRDRPWEARARPWNALTSRVYLNELGR